MGMSQVTVTIHSGAETETGAGGSNLRNHVRHATYELDVTAVAGTSPTLDLLIEESVDGTNWSTALTFAQKTAASRQVLKLEHPTPFIRASWTIGGSAGQSLTFTVKALQQVYEL